MFILGFRPGSVIVDYKMTFGKTETNTLLVRDDLVEMLKVVIEENQEKTIFVSDFVVVEGKKGEEYK